MVKKVFSLLHTEIRGLHQAAYLLGLSALASQFLALVRDRLLANTFGASVELDIYFAAFRIPDFVFVLAASIVSLSVIIPVLATKMEKGVEQARDFLNSIFTFFAFLVLLICFLVFLIIPFIAPIIFSGFDVTALHRGVIPLSRIMLISPILLGISTLLGSITQFNRKFAVYAIAPLLYNVGIIIGITILYPILGFNGLGWGVLLGALLHMVVQLPGAIQSGFIPRIRLPIDFSAVLEVARISIPRTLALSIQQLTLIFLTSIGSSLAAGSIAVFSLSFNLQSIPLSIIGVSYTVAAFPTLSRLYSHGKHQEFMLKISASLRHIIFWSLPATSFFIVLRAQIVRVIYGAGEFGWTGTRLTAAVLALFSVSILAQSVILFLSRSFYATGRTKVPLFINVMGMICVISGSVVFLNFFKTFPDISNYLGVIMRLEGVNDLGVLVLPVAYSLGFIITAVILWKKFENSFGKFPENIPEVFFKSAVAAFVAGVVTFALLNVFDNLVDLTTSIGVLTQGFMSGLGGILVQIAVLKIMKSRELEELGRVLRNKLWRTRAVLPGEDERVRVL